MLDFLPSPTWFTAIGAACVLGAAAAIFFLKSTSIAFDLGVAAAVLFLCAAIAHTYEARGEATVQAKFDAFKAAQTKLAADIKAQQDQAIAKVQADADARIAAEKGRSDELAAKVAALQHRNVVLSGALSDVLQHSGAGPSVSDTGTKPGGQDAAPAVPQSTGPETYDEHELGEYFAASRAAYDSALNAWQACVSQYDAIRAPTLGKGLSP